MFSQIKYALRQFRKEPWFTLTAVLILALAIGSNTAVFTVIDGLLLRGLRATRPDELVLFSQRNVPDTQGGDGTQLYFSYANYERFRSQQQSLQGILVTSMIGTDALTTGTAGGHATAEAGVIGVSGNFFSVLGVNATLGRILMPEDDRPEAAGTAVVLSNAFWRRNFGSDPSVVGRNLLLDATPVTIVGVAAPKFDGVELGVPVDAWIPMERMPIVGRMKRMQLHGPAASKYFAFFIMGRLRPGVSRQSAAAELDFIFQADLRQAGFKSDPHISRFFGTLDLLPGGSGYLRAGMSNGRGRLTFLLGILMAVVGVVMIVACANVAGLLLAQGAVRQRDLALRTALGATPWRLLAQLATEGLLLSAMGGAAGLVLAHWGTHALAVYLPGNGYIDYSPDLRVFGFVAAVVLIGGLLVGLVPALKLGQSDLTAALKDRANTLAGGSAQKLNRTLVAAQIALSFCLLTGGGLFVRTLENLKNIDPGFNPRRLLIASLPLDRSYDSTRRSVLLRDALSRLEALPGVRRATFSTAGGGILAGGISAGMQISAEGFVPKKDDRMDIYLSAVGPNFFDTLGMLLVRGRSLGPADMWPASTSNGAALPIDVVVNEALVKRYFSQRDPIGRRIRSPEDDIAKLLKQPQTNYRIVGVVKDTKFMSLREDHSAQMFAPFYRGGQVITFELRTFAEPGTVMASVRTVLHSIDPKLPEAIFTTMDDVLDHAVSQERMAARAAGFFSLFALLLASLGLYGILAYSVACRTREIGVRMAIGAGAGQIVSMIVRQGLALAAIGCAAGILVAIPLAQIIASRLYAISSYDPVTFAATAIVLLSVAFLACWLPARRATRVDPIISLRSE